MTTSLIDEVSKLASPDFVARAAAQLGEPEQNVSRGMHGSMASMLMGLLGTSGNPTAMQQTFGTITNSANDGRVLDDPASLIGAQSDSPLSSLGGQFTSAIFGNRSSAVNDAIGASSGLRGESIVSLLRFGAPLLLGVLGKRIREGGLNASTFTRLISGERDSIQRAAPPGVSRALGMDERVVSEPVYREGVRDETARAEPARSYDRPAQEPEHGRRFRPIILGVAAVVLLFSLWPRHRHTQVASIDTSQIGSAAGQLAPPVVTPVSPGLPAAPIASTSVIAIRLPNGKSIQAPANGPEAQLSTALSAPGNAVDATWILLDRTQFQGNTARVGAASNDQLRAIAAIASAFPNATFKIAGYTDSTGNVNADMKVSRERADNARAIIVRSGVAPSRISTEGDGSANPVADNSTDAGRAQNRRVLIQVVRR